MKGHEIAAVVNQLRDIATEYRDAQQLRARIASLIVPLLESASNAGEAVAWMLNWSDGQQTVTLQDPKEIYRCPPDDITPLYTRAALASAQTPEGWKLVPVEPTDKMWDAVNKLDDQMAAGGYDGKGCSIEQAWDCLLAAAPNAPESKEG